MNSPTSLPDTRSVTVTNDSVVVDGRDVSNMVTAVHFSLRPNSFPVVELEIAPDAVLYSGPAVVPEVPLDGIERLRKRLGR